MSRPELIREVERLQETLWALQDAPWTKDAPGLRAYVRVHLHSGRVQLDPQQRRELEHHLREWSLPEPKKATRLQLGLKEALINGG